MLLSERYLITEIFGSYVLLPVGQAVLDGMSVAKINESTYNILKLIEYDELSIDEIVKKLKNEYDNENDSQIKESVQNFLRNAVYRGIVYDTLPHGYRKRAPIHK